MVHTPYMKAARALAHRVDKSPNRFAALEHCSLATHRSLRHSKKRTPIAVSPIAFLRVTCPVSSMNKNPAPPLYRMHPIKPPAAPESGPGFNKLNFIIPIRDARNVLLVIPPGKLQSEAAETAGDNEDARSALDTPVHSVQVRLS